MRKNLFITLAVLSGMAISMTACLLGDVEALQKKASETNLGVTVNIAEIRGVTVPATGEIPVRNIVDNDQYNGTVTWSPTPGSSGFTYQTKYTATITLTPKKGYSLHFVKANFFTVAGAESVSNAANSGIVTAVFTATKKITVSISIIAPVKGVTPAVTASSSDESGNNFSIGPVSWSPFHNPFLGGKVYTASVTLTAKNGYTFNGLSSATINGQEASVSNNTGSTVTLSYTFAETDTRTVTSIAVKTQPTKLIYMHGDTLNLAGLVVTLTHDDSTTEDVASTDFTAKNVTATPAQGNDLVHSMHNGQSVKITYGNLTIDTYNLTVNKATPTANDFYISGTGTFDNNGSFRTVTITPKDGKTTGSITVKYNGNITEPSAAGIYTVTFDVAETTNFNSASGLFAGTLTIEAVFYDLYSLNSYLQNNPANTAATPYAVALNVNDLGGDAWAVRSIGYMLHQNPTKYVNLDLSGSTITSIEWSAFSYCTGLTSVTIPDGVTNIGYYAFSGCTSLSTINVDSSNINYSSDQGVLYNKNKTTLVVYPEGKKDNSFTIPNGVTSIGYGVFSGCTGLTSVTIPDGVTSIEGNTFYICTNLSTINVDSNNINYSSTNGILYNKNKTTLIKYPEGKKDSFFTIPNGVTSIEEGAFSYCTSLTSVTIPNGVTSIEEGAFSYCTSLTSVTIPNGVTSIGNGVFSGCTGLTSVTIPDSVTSIRNGVFSGCTGLTSVTIPNGVTIIEGNVFYGCTSLSTINVDSSNINYSSTNGILYNKNKTTLIKYPEGKKDSFFIIPNGVTIIEGNVFYGCTNLTSVTIPDSVTSIGSGAFYGCSGLTSVTIPDSVTSIKGYAFSACTGLTSVTFGGTISLNNFDDNAFGGTYNYIYNEYIGDLRVKYLAGGLGTYTRASGGTVWTKQP